MQFIINNESLNKCTKISISKLEFDSLVQEKIINSDGKVSKDHLKEVEEYLQSIGWNGFFIELHDRNKFDKISDIVEFIVK